MVVANVYLLRLEHRDWHLHGADELEVVHLVEHLRLLHWLVDQVHSLHAIVLVRLVEHYVRNGSKING